MYLLYGDDQFKIKNEIDKIINENNILSVNITKYDLNNDSYRKILMDAYTISLFQERKVIIVYNANLFEAKTNKDEQELKEWTKYFENPNSNTILILVTDTVSTNRKIYKSFKGKALECIKSLDINLTVKEMFENYKISDELVNLLISRVGNDLYRLINETNKIKTYKNNDYVITKDDILNLTTNNIDADYNKLIEYIIEDNKDQALLIYDEFIKQNQDVISILLGLSKKIRLMYQVKELSLKGYSDQDIADIVKESKGYVYYLKKDASKYSSNVLKSYLIKFADMDYQYKIGNINLNNYFKLFIISK